MSTPHAKKCQFPFDFIAHDCFFSLSIRLIKPVHLCPITDTSFRDEPALASLATRLAVRPSVFAFSPLVFDETYSRHVFTHDAPLRIPVRLLDLIATFGDVGRHSFLRVLIP
jgi:hypothetical protein